MRHSYLLPLLLIMFAAPVCAKQSNTAADTAAAGVDVRVAFPHLSFTNPLDVQSPDDGSNRLFVVEQRGTIRVFDNDSATTDAATFLDIRSKVTSGGEEGLLSLAFDPQFEQNGYFYVYYSASNPRHSVVARYTVSGADPDSADAASEYVIMQIPEPFANHNGGRLLFGPDGQLYIGLGDGGSGGDPNGNGQNPATLLASILRIDVHDTTDSTHYAIPPDNPFVGNDKGWRQEIWAYGLRNPWRFSFDSETGRLWAGDVGQDAWEEVDLIEKGGNYGWNTMEGYHCYAPSSGCDSSGLTSPLWEYSHSVGISITGGFVYRGSRIASLQGSYVFGDFGSGRIWALDYDPGSGSVSVRQIATGTSISSFGVDADRELYFTSFDGHIYTFAEQMPGEVGLLLDTIRFDSTAVGSTKSATRAVARNNGAHPATIDSVRLRGPDADAFAITGTLDGTSLDASAALTVELTFTPDTPRGYDARLAIYTNGGDAPETVQLIGEGILVAAVESGAGSTSALEIRPNPSVGRMAISWRQRHNDRAHLELVDGRGRRIATLLDEDRAVGEQRVDVDTSGLPAGTYLVRLTTGDASTIAKVIVE